MQLNDRLRIERDKLDLTQIEIAKVCGVSYRTYCDYEAGKTEPKASFFAQLDEMGADVMFILTGHYSVKNNISMEEQKIIENYRIMSEESRLNMQTISSVFAQSTRNKQVKNG